MDESPDMHISRPTASIYLNKLCEANFLTKYKLGVSNFYINEPLLNLFTSFPAQV